MRVLLTLIVVLVLIGSNSSAPPGSSTQETAGSTPGTGSVSYGHRVKLSKHSMHPFDGNITKLTSFWDSFKSTIDSSPRLSEIVIV